MNNTEFARTLFGPGMSKPDDAADAAKKLFGAGQDTADTPEKPPPATGPYIPGQERMPEKVQGPRNAEFIGDLFN